MVNYCIYFISGHDFIKYQVMDDHGLHLSPSGLTGNRLTAFIYFLVLYFRCYVQRVIFFIDSGSFYKINGSVGFKTNFSATRRCRLQVN